MMIIQNVLASIRYLTLSLILVMLMLAYNTSIIYAQPARDSVCSGIGAVSGTDGCSAQEGEPDIDNTVSTVVNILSSIVAVIAVIMIIIGGLKYVTSQGDGGGTASAKNTVIYALVGLVIVALAQILVRFALERV